MILRADSVRPRRAREIPRPGAWLALFAAAFAARLLYAWLAQGPNATPSSDALQIDTVAWNLARGAGFSFDGEHGPYPTGVVPPVVPWIVSLLYRAAGHRYFAALVLQCAIGALAPLAASSIGAAMFGTGTGRLAGWLTALHPLLVFFGAYLLTETTFTTVLLVALLASLSWVKAPRPARALGVGLLWGVATLTRPTALLLPALITVWAWVPLGLTVAPRERARQLVMLLLGVALALAPWSVRNSMLTGRFVPIKTGGGRTFFDANNPVVWGDRATRGGAANMFAVEPWASKLRGHDELTTDSIASAEAWTFLNAHRAEWPAMAAAKVARFWRLRMEGGATGTWQREGSPLSPLLSRVDPLLAWSVLVLPFALWGAVRSLMGPRRWFQSILLAVIALFTLLAIPYWGALRLRVPIEPLVVLLAAAGFDDVRRRWMRRGRGLTVISGRRAGTSANG
jgi:hypothetical protein